MSGFPTRTGRGGYGPDPINSRPVRDPARQLDGETVGRLMFWQLGGLGLVAPIATFGATVTGSAVSLAWHAEAFQPAGGNGPTLTYTSAGVYAVSYSASYPDETSNASPLVLRGGAAIALGASVLHGQVEIGSSGYAATVRFWALPAVTAANPAAFFVAFW